MAGMRLELGLWLGRSGGSGGDSPPAAPETFQRMLSNGTLATETEPREYIINGALVSETLSLAIGGFLLLTGGGHLLLNGGGALLLNGA